MPTCSVEIDVILLLPPPWREASAMEGSLYHIDYVLMSYCLPGKKHSCCYEETKKNTSERRDSRLNLYKGIQVKVSSSFFSSFFLAKISLI